MKEAAVGADAREPQAAIQRIRSGETVAAFLRRNADWLEAAEVAGSAAEFLQRSVRRNCADSARARRQIGDKIRALEDLERRLTVLEEKLFAVLLAATPDDEIVAVRAEADRDWLLIAAKCPGAQIDQLQKQYVHKRLLEKYGLPRLSLFYM